MKAAVLAVGAAILFAAAGPCAMKVNAQAVEAPKVEVPADAAASEVRGEVVTVAVEAKTVTLKVSTGDAMAEMQLSVEGDALAALGELKAGEHVVASCREGTAADKCVVTAVRKGEAGK